MIGKIIVGVVAGILISAFIIHLITDYTDKKEKRGKEDDYWDNVKFENMIKARINRNSYNVFKDSMTKNEAMLDNRRFADSLRLNWNNAKN